MTSVVNDFLDSWLIVGSRWHTLEIQHFATAYERGG